MAIRYAIANGVWSNPAIWDGGVALPTAADDVFANNFTVTIDQDINVRTLRNTSNAAPVIAANGFFNVTGNTGTRTITLTGATGTGGTSASGVFSNTSVVAFRVASTSGATVNLSFPVGLPQTSTSSILTIDGNAIVNYTGAISQPLAFASHFKVNNTSAGGTFNIVGNLLGGSAVSTGCLWTVCNGYTINVTGNVTANNDYGIFMQAATTLNITGNVFGGAANAITFNGGSATATITGNVTAGVSAGISNNGTNSTFIINGNVTASSTANGLLGTNIGTLYTVNGNLINTSDYNAVNAQKMRISPTSQQTWTFQTSGPNRQMFTANAFSGGTMPVASDVRYGVSYAGGALSGTCYVPAAASVAYGVPVDATTGTSVINRAQLLSDIGSLMAAYPQI